MTAIDTIASQPNVSTTERSITAIFKNREQIDDVIRRLIERCFFGQSICPKITACGISREDISVIGQNFHSKTKIAGFITKKDVVLGGLRQGAI